MALTSECCSRKSSSCICDAARPRMGLGLCGITFTQQLGRAEIPGNNWQKSLIQKLTNSIYCFTHAAFRWSLISRRVVSCFPCMPYSISMTRSYALLSWHFPPYHRRHIKRETNGFGDLLMGIFCCGNGRLHGSTSGDIRLNSGFVSTSAGVSATLYTAVQ